MLRALLRSVQLLIVAAAIGVSSVATADEAVRIERVPDGGIQPQVMVDTDGTVHLIYFQGEPGAGDVFYVHRAAGATSFSGPIRVNSQSGSVIAVGSIRGAQLAIGKGNRVHVAWNGSGKAEPRGPGKWDAPMLYTRMNDTRMAFEPQRDVIGQAYVLDGGGSVAADAAGNVYVAWHAGSSGEANRRVWVVRSTDEGRTFVPETAVDSEKLGACGCCGMKAFADSQGSVFFLYRSARENVNRDLQLLASKDGGRTFSNQRMERWMIATCPMSSEAFVEGPGGTFAAWETNGQVSFARIDAESRGIPRPTAAPGEGSGRKHPSLAVARDGRLLLAWDEGTGWQKGGALAWQEFDAQGKPTRTRGKQDGIPVWSFTAAYARPDGTFVILY